MCFRTYFQKPSIGALFHKARLIVMVSVTLLLTLTSTLGRAAPQAPQEKEIYGAWVYECKPLAGSAKDECVANQLVMDVKTKQAVLGVMIGYLAGHPMPHVIFRLSPNANKYKGAAVKVDKSEPFKIPINNCDKKICEIRSFLPNQLLSQMKKGEQMLFAFHVEGKQITYPVSLNGLADILSHLEKGISTEPTAIE